MTKREPMWSLKEYAELLGITPKQLYRRMEREGIILEREYMHSEDCVPMTHRRGKAPRYPLSKLKALIG